LGGGAEKARAGRFPLHPSFGKKKRGSFKMPISQQQGKKTTSLPEEKRKSLHQAERPSQVEGEKGEAPFLGKGKKKSRIA